MTCYIKLIFVLFCAVVRAFQLYYPCFNNCSNFVHFQEIAMDKVSGKGIRGSPICFQEIKVFTVHLELNCNALNITLYGIGKL